MPPRRSAEPERPPIQESLREGAINDAELEIINKQLGTAQEYGVNLNNGGKYKEVYEDGVATLGDHAVPSLDQLRAIRYGLVDSISPVTQDIIEERDKIEHGKVVGKIRVKVGEEVLYHPEKIIKDPSAKDPGPSDVIRVRDPKLKNQAGEEIKPDVVGSILNKTTPELWLLSAADKKKMERATRAVDFIEAKPKFNIVPTVAPAEKPTLQRIKDRIVRGKIKTPSSKRIAPKREVPIAESVIESRLTPKEIKEIKAWYKADPRNKIGQHAAILASDQKVLDAYQVYARGRLRLHDEIIADRKGKPERPYSGIETRGKRPDEPLDVTVDAHGAEFVGDIPEAKIAEFIDASMSAKRTELAGRRTAYREEAVKVAEREALTIARAAAKAESDRIQAQFDAVYKLNYDRELTKRGPNGAREAARLADIKTRNDKTIGKLLAGKDRAVQTVLNETFKSERTTRTSSDHIEAVVDTRIQRELLEHELRLAEHRRVAAHTELGDIKVAEQYEKDRDAQLDILEDEERVRETAFDEAFEHETLRLEADLAIKIKEAEDSGRSPRFIDDIKSSYKKLAEGAARAHVAREVASYRKSVGYSEEKMDEFLPETILPRIVEDFDDAVALFIEAEKSSNEDEAHKASLRLQSIARKHFDQTGSRGYIDSVRRNYTK